MDISVRIPFPNSSDWLVALVHFPETIANESCSIDTGNSKDIVVIVHGIAAHKNNPPLLTHLAHSMPYPSIRFDMRGCGDSSGAVLRMTDYYEAVKDLSLVCDWLKERGWRILCLIGHSMGSMISLLYLLQNPDSVARFVSISGRYCFKDGLCAKIVRDKVIEQSKLDIYLQQRSIPDYRNLDLKNGSVIAVKGWRGGSTDASGNKIKGQIVEYTVDFNEVLRTWERLDEDILKIESLPSSLQTLVIHGTVDNVIPVNDAYSLAKVLPSNKSIYIQECNHNLTSGENEPINHKQFACNAILEWMAELDLRDQPSRL